MVLMSAASPPRYALQTYNGHQLEIKSLAIGWQVIITRDGAYVSNGNVEGSLPTALEEARKSIDAQVTEPSPLN